MTLPLDTLYDRSRGFAAVVGAKGGTPVRILIGGNKQCCASKTGQAILTALCDILPRISERYVRIALCLREAPYLLSDRIDSASTLAQALLSRLHAVCPWGEFAAVSAPWGQYDFCISLGQGWQECERTLYIYASGWQSYVSQNAALVPYDGEDFNPFASLATASLAAMAIYGDAERISPLSSWKGIDGWSLFDFSMSESPGPPLPPLLEVRTVVQAGLGGSANALLWALRYGPTLKGRWFAFEPEILELSNSNRYLLMTPADDGLPKALVAKREFSGWQPQLEFNVVRGRIEEASGSFPNSCTVLATVDDENVRIDLQRRYPALLLNVGTASQYLSLSRHLLEDIRNNAGPCLHCLYREPQAVGRRQREATVSYVTALVGALVGAELVKNFAFPGYTLRYAWLGNVFCPTEAHPYIPPRIPTCPTCSAAKE